MNGLNPQIPMSAAQQPSFVEQMGGALQMAGAYEKQQEYNEQRKDQQIIQEALKSGANLSTPEGIFAAAEQLKGMVSPKTYQTLTQAHQESLLNEKKQIEALAKGDIAKIDLADRKSDMLIRAGKPVFDQYNEDLKSNAAKGSQEAQRIASENFQKNWQQQIQSAASTGIFQPQELQEATKWSPDVLKKQIEGSEYFQKLSMAATKLRKEEQDIRTSAALEKKYGREPVAGAAATAREGAAGGMAGIAMAGGNVGMRNMPYAVKEIQDKYPWLNEKEIGSRIQQASGIRTAIKDQEKQLGRLVGFEKTAMANIDNLDKAVKEARAKNTYDIPVVNSFLNTIRRAAGIPYNEAVALYGQEVAAELAKLASSANASGVGGTLHDRQEWKDFFSANGSYNQIKKSIEAAKQSAENRINSSLAARDANEQRIQELWQEPGQTDEGKPKESTVVPHETGTDILSILKKHGVKK